MSEVRKWDCVSDPGIVELADSLKMLSDPNRLRILCLLLRGERCVCEVEKELGVSQQLASHHLSVLRESGLLKLRKAGTSSYYSVVEEKLDHVMAIFARYLGYRQGGSQGDEAACSAAAPTGAGAEGRGVSRRKGGKA